MVRRETFFFFFQAEDGIRDDLVTGVQTCALPICERDSFRLHKPKHSSQGLMVSRKTQSDSGTIEDSSYLSLGEQRSGGCSNKLPTKPNSLLIVSACNYIHLRQFPFSCLR